ncbi:hypothetical protein CSW75_26405, partial [Shigella flexneri]
DTPENDAAFPRQTHAGNPALYPQVKMVCQMELKWHTEFGHLNRGDMLTSEQHRCSNEKKEILAQSLNANPLNWLLTRNTRWQMPPKLWMLAFPQ